MSEKPDDVTQDAWDEALRYKNSVDYRNMSACEFVARAIMAAEKRGEERERAACELIAQDWTGGAEYIAAAIRKRGA